ncbi:MAG TPA: NYN domain-containing protein [Jiangellaceae bacterium]|nr:NYN domain-containing protein [Jiangellaceae bacterium]
MTDVVAYVDGFNLYNGLRKKHGRRYLWLDLEALCASLLLSDQRLSAVRYFTATVRRKPASLRRQQAYWYALEAQCRRITIELGRFQQKSVTCRSCRNTWLSYEEKETDVAIAVGLVEDAASRRFDTALVVSADGDLCPAVRAVQRIHPSAKVVAAFPPARRSDELRNAVDASFTIAERKLQRALLPDKVVGPGGKVVARPGRWR